MTNQPTTYNSYTFTMSSYSICKKVDTIAAALVTSNLGISSDDVAKAKTVVNLICTECNDAELELPSDLKVLCDVIDPSSTK